MTITAIILDTETTGINKPEPVEVAYFTFTDIPLTASIINRHLYGFSQRFKPSKSIEAGASKIHGIHYSDVQNATPWEFKAIDLPQATDADPIYIIGHNIAFDIRALSFGNDAIKANLTEIYKPICTLKIARKAFPEIKELGGYSLSNISSHIFSEFAAEIQKIAHGAKADCLLTMCLIDKICAEYDIKTWEELYNIQ